MQPFTDWLDRCFTANTLWFHDEWGIPADLIHEALLTPPVGDDRVERPGDDVAAVAESGEDRPAA